MKLFVCIFALVALAQAKINVNDLEFNTIKVLAKTPAHHDGSRIIGGKEAVAGQIPYQAALYIDGRTFCGGTLISKNYVLTAAHCADGASNIVVILGARNLNTAESTQQRINSASIVVHPGWSWSNLINDLAIVKLSRPAQINNYVKTMNLPSRQDVSNDFKGAACRASGWGKTSDTAGGITSILKYVDSTIISNADCANYFGSYIVPTTICASGSGHISTCNGDSGGPLVSQGVNGKIQVGITSFVSGGGCELSAPFAFTRVTKYLDWIASNSDVVIN